MVTRPLATLPLLATLTAFPLLAQGQSPALAKATFAAGCFWCTEEAMDKVPGVVSTTSGYMGGSRKNPTTQGRPRKRGGTGPSRSGSRS